jgi:hypothetical protein
LSGAGRSSKSGVDMVFAIAMVKQPSVRVTNPMAACSLDCLSYLSRRPSFLYKTSHSAARNGLKL